MDLSGGSLRNENVKNSKELLKETFADDASFTPGVYFWEHGLKSYEGRDTLGIRFYKKSFSNANGVSVKFQTLIDSPVIVGDVIYDSVADEYLICTESFNIDDIHWQGKLTLCNWILKWQNKNGYILEYPCNDINSTQYNSGEQANSQFTIGSSQHMLTLPYDENTVVIKTPQRFFLDKDVENPTSFIVTQNDNTSFNYGKKGLVKLTVLECELNNDTDRIDLGICDYIDKNEIKTDNADNRFISKSVISFDTNTIKSGGSSQTFIGQFFDENGDEVESIIANWNVICDFVDALNVEENGNRISIGIDNDDFVDEEFKLILSDANGNYQSSIIIKIGSLL
jgi:hypothetical protein